MYLHLEYSLKFDLLTLYPAKTKIYQQLGKKFEGL